VKTPRDSRRTILLLGNYRPTISLARTLASRNYRVVVTRDWPNGYAQFSRAVSECWDHPPIEQPEELFSALGQFLADRKDISVVLPISEEYVRGLVAYSHLLPDDRVYATPDNATVETCLDKPKMNAIAAQAGAASPTHIQVSDYAALKAAIQSLGFPVIVKPTNSTVRIDGAKAVILASNEQLDQRLPVWPPGHQALIAQAYVDGPRINLYFAASRGRPLRYLATKISTTDTPDGVGLAVDGMTIDLEENVKRLGDAIILRLDYHGIGLMQFLADSATGELSFLELNPRISGSHDVTEHCSLDLGGLAIKLAERGAVDEALQIGRAGERYVWTSGALSGLYRSLKAREITVSTFFTELLATIRAAFAADSHMTWNWRDPMPSLVFVGRRLPLGSKINAMLSRQSRQTSPADVETSYTRRQS